MHDQNLQKLVVGIYIAVNGWSPEIINEAFQFQMQDYYNLRNNLLLAYHLLMQHSQGRKIYPTYNPGQNI